MLIGGDPIQSFTDGTTESDLADAVYEDIVRAALTSSRWRFATKQFQLNRLADVPIGRWDSAYQLPSDSLMINSITVQDLPIEFDTYEDKIYNNAVAADEAEHAGRWELEGSSASFKGIGGVLTPHRQKPLTH